MNITLNRPELEKLKGMDAVDEYLRYNSWHAKVSLKLDVGTLSPSEFSKVEKVLKADPVNNARQLKSIELFKLARENPKNSKAATHEQFATILKGYIASVPKFRIYQEGDDGDYDAYVATSVGFVKAKRERGYTRPAYVFLKAAYYYKGEVCYAAWNFEWQEVKGRTCAEVLDNSCLLTGSPELDSRYEAELKKYLELRGAVGKQVWGKGTCSSVTRSWWGRDTYSLDVDGRKTRLVVDSHVEGEDRNKNEATEGKVTTIDGSFWKTAAVSDDDDDTAVEADENTQIILEVPLRPHVLLFNLEKHIQCLAHVNRLEDYVYDKTLGDKLILPEYQRKLIDILVQRDRAEMVDIVSGKAGGSIVLSSGPPGTGKTLTAEVFAEVIERPLYVVASSQLGVNTKDLEAELKLVLARATRLGAIMLIDEADVFLHARGEDLVQNSIVGTFLRILEYFNGTLFFTTNRETLIDDAILSRVTAQVKFGVPTPEDQAKIWRILADLSGIDLKDTEIKKFVKKHPGLVGRDVKGLLKLSNMVAAKDKTPITCESIEFLMQFKPTAESAKGDS